MRLLNSLCVLMMALFGAPVLTWSQAEEAGQMIDVKRNVFYVRAQATSKAEKYMDLLDDDNVYTQQLSRAKIKFVDESLLTLGPMSRLFVREYRYSTKEKRASAVCELLDGKLRLVVGNANFKVVTPTAMATAEGTVLVVWYDSATGISSITVVEGQARVENRDKAVLGTQVLTVGQMTQVPMGEPPGKPEPITSFAETQIMADVLMPTLPDPVTPLVEHLPVNTDLTLETEVPGEEQPIIPTTEVGIELGFPTTEVGIGLDFPTTEVGIELDFPQ